jgi:L-ascorbate metabolism protein UlaG (beta-lactamase superfamily)
LFSSHPSHNLIQLRWLGVAGIELRAADQVLVIDPYLTRVPFWRVVFGRLHPEPALITQYIPRCDFVLVTHSHFDHLMDVPAVVRHTGALALGSSNTCRLLALSGVPAEQIREIDVGDRLVLGDFRVQVFLAEHATFWGWLPFSGPLRPNLRPPLRARDYRMDRCFSFLVQVGGHRLLHCPGPALPADVLLVKPLGTRPRYESLLRGVRPRVVIPVHWDDFGRPLSKLVRPMLAPSGRAIPPLRRIDLAQFERMIERTAPETKVLIPEMFRPYDLDGLAEGSLGAFCSVRSAS